jgi:hypothetical protein
MCGRTCPFGVTGITNQLIHRATGHNLCTLTNDGLRFAVFYSKVHNRLLRPLITSDQPQTPPELRAAFRTIDHHIHRHLSQARLPTP